MERDISGGANIGVTLLILAAVISLGFGIFAIVKSLANEGTVNVQDSLATVSSQVFLDYDQKIVTGTQAVSALKTFEGKPYAVLIGTKSLQKGGKLAVEHTKAFPVGTGGTIVNTGTAQVVGFINYNALIATGEGVADGGTYFKGGEKVATLNQVVEFKNGTYIMKTGFQATGGNIVFDKETAGIYKAGNAEYIPTSSKFQANLLKDESENIVGIVLEQI